MRNRLIKISIALITLLIGSNTALADPGHMNEFTIYPSVTHNGNKAWIIQNIAQGNSITEYVTLENLSHQKQTIRLMLTEVNENFGPTNTKENIGLWTSAAQESFTLEAYEKIQVPIQIEIPKNAVTKEYTGAIFATTDFINEQNVKIVSQIGVRMYITVIEPTLPLNIFTNPGYKSYFFFILSLMAVLGAFIYNHINEKQIA